MKNTFSIGICALTLIATIPAMAQTKVGFGLDRGLGVTAQLENRYNLFIGNDGIAADYLFSRGQWNEFKEIEGAPLTT